MTLISDLYAVQELDASLDAVLAELTGVVERLDAGGVDPALTMARDGAQSILQEAHSAQRDAETAIADHRAKMEPVERRLYSGEVKDLRELQGLQRDFEAQKRRLTELENRQLEVMSEVETARGSAEAAREQLQSAQSAASEETDRLTQRRRELEAEQSRLEPDRERRLLRFDERTRALYERLRKAKRGRAVAKIERGVCGGCRISLPTNVVQRARSGMQVVQCTSCERILFAG